MCIARSAHGKICNTVTHMPPTPNPIIATVPKADPPARKIGLKKVVMLVLLGIVLLVAYWFVYHSSIYLSTFSHRIGGGTGDGFYAVSYPTHQRVFYFRHWVGGEWPFQTLAMQVGFVDGADPKSFEVLGKYYARDKNQVYFAFYQSRRVVALPIKGSLQLLSEYYLADGDSVYFGGQELAGAHASGFVFLDPPTAPYGADIGGDRTFDARYARSGDTMYYGGAPVEARRDGAFIKSITHATIPCNPIEKQYSQGNTICKITSDAKDQSITVDAATFSVFEPASPLHAYAKDKNHVYFAYRYDCSEACGTLHVVEGADLPSFTVQGKDAFSSYVYGCKLFPTEVDDGVRRGGGVGYGYCDYY